MYGAKKRFTFVVGMSDDKTESEEMSHSRVHIHTQYIRTPYKRTPYVRTGRKKLAQNKLSQEIIR